MAADYASRTRALDEPDSRAEKEAERLVSLPPERLFCCCSRNRVCSLSSRKCWCEERTPRGGLSTRRN